MFNIRTDLAIEAREIYRETAVKKEEEAPGIICETDGDDDIVITRVQITSEEGERALGKKMGRYITLEIPRLKQNDPELQIKATEALCHELRRMIGEDEDRITLVAGLGNSKITPDSLGPKVISSLMVTRHLFSNLPEGVGEGLSPVCALAPGVLGLTGIETGEIIRGVAERVSPQLVIAVDSLASRRMDRVSTTIQIADTGISPGSGVGNRRQTLDEESLGVPVIAVGVPMVVDAATIANDSIDQVIDALIEQTDKDKDFYKLLKGIDKDQKHRLISEVLPESVGSMMVTPKEVDFIADRVSKILANGINLCLHRDLTQEEINAFVS